MGDLEYNRAAASEYNEALWAREYAPPREYGVTRERDADERNAERRRKRASSLRQRALMQATAAVMTAVVAVSAAAAPTQRSPAIAPSNAPRAAETSSPVENVFEPIFETAEPTAVSVEAGTPYPEEYRYILDHLIELCAAGNRDGIVSFLNEEPLILEAGQMFEDCCLAEEERDKDGTGQCYYNGSLITRNTGNTPALYFDAYSYDIAPICVFLEYFQAGDDRFSGTDGCSLLYQVQIDRDEPWISFFQGTRKETSEFIGMPISVSGRFEERIGSMVLISMEGEFVTVHSDPVEKVLLNPTVYDEVDEPYTFLENGTLDYFNGVDYGSSEVRNGFLIPNGIIEITKPDFSSWPIEESQKSLYSGLLQIANELTPDRGGLQNSLYHTRLQWIDPLS